MPAVRVLLISRDDILAGMETESGDKMLRLLATLTRNGYHLIATAPQPDHWSGEHGSPDDALLGPTSIRKRLSDMGGMLDGVYYVRRSMLTQKRISQEALQDILQRYSAEPENCRLFSSRRKFVRRAADLGLNATLLDRDTPLDAELAALCEARLAETASRS